MILKKYKPFFIFSIAVIMVCCCSGKNQLDSNKTIPKQIEVISSQNRTDRRLNNQNIADSRQNAITAAVSKVSPAIVGINVIQIQRYIQRSPFDDDPFWRMFFPPREYEQRVKGLGSGFLISEEGYILTNEHVVENAAEIVITATDGKQYKADLVGKDFMLDVALLKIKGTDFPFIPLGDSDSILIGEWVIAFGNPFGLFDVNSKPTVTVGVISANGMNFQGALQIEGRSYNDMIQTDAAINGGNSGGPLINSLGECIGINTFIISGSEYQKTSIGIGFASPINRVKKILPDLKRIGRVERTVKMGFRFRNLTTAEARALGISVQNGVLIIAILPGSSAENTGLKTGDVIVAVDGNPIHSEEEFRKTIQEYQTQGNSSIKITVFRRGRLYETSLPLEYK